MPIQELDSGLKSLEQKIKLLLRQNDHLQKENKKLQKEKAENNLLLNEKNNTIQKMQQQLDVLLLDAPSISKSEKTQLEQRINGYLKDIEKCMAILNS